MGRSEIGRLALRHEGEFWNAYWSPDQRSMTKAVLLGSIRMSLVPPGSDTHAGFMRLMRMAFEAVVLEEMGQAPTWGGFRRAPENERGGHG